MAHNCEIKKVNVPLTPHERFKRKITSFIVVSPTNPLRFGKFKSDLSVRMEQKRHLQVNKYAVHPFSKFRGMYEVYLVFLHTSILALKPLTTFFYLTHYKQGILKAYSLLMDVLCWTDIIMTFFTGYVGRKQGIDVIELRFRKIAKHYILGPYFVCDVLSSIPKVLFYQFHPHTNLYKFTAVLDVLMFLKFVRMVPLFVYVYRSAQYIGIKSKTWPFLANVMLTAIMIVHWAACLQFGVSKVAGYASVKRKEASWIFRYKLYTRPVLAQYLHCFFKSSAYILSIQQNLYDILLPEEYIAAILTYLIGKLLVAFVWLILAGSILNSRSIEIKYWELMNQLEEYMWRFRLPLYLRGRMSRYYEFKFQRQYFKEQFIQDSFPDTVKREVTMHICKIMLKEVAIFSDLQQEEVRSLVDYLTPEIFLPHDVIIHHGTYAHAMYFLFSGTVAVYTRSGKEICHLQEGTYFGEISLLLPGELRMISVIAIETSQVFKLLKKDFEAHFLSNFKVLQKLIKGAEDRMLEVSRMEDKYNALMIERSYRNSLIST